MSTKMLLLLAFFAIGAPAQATIPRITPVVVADLPGTISTAPFFDRLESDAEASVGNAPRRDARADASWHIEFPLVASRLLAGEPSVVVNDALPRPIFVVGSGPASRTWLHSAGRALALTGAKGVVVDARDEAAWRQIQAIGQEYGLRLQLMHDTALVEDYGLVTYPVVIASPEALTRPTDE